LKAKSSSTKNGSCLPVILGKVGDTIEPEAEVVEEPMAQEGAG